MCVYLCGGSCVEDVTTHLMRHLSLHPSLRTCSADTILRAIEELTCENTTYQSASGRVYDFNTADKMNSLLVNALLATGQLKAGQEYDFDFDHQFIETEKYDAKPTYKKFLGYSPGVAVLGDVIVGIENRDGNTNVCFNQKETLERIFKRLEASGEHVARARMDCGSCSEEIVGMVVAHCKHFLCFQVCLRPSKMEQDITKACVGHLYRQSCLRQVVPARLLLKPGLFG